MAYAGRSRVSSVKTPRGSADPVRHTGRNVIVQRAAPHRQDKPGSQPAAERLYYA
jgi:hypothetical protein